MQKNMSKRCKCKDLFCGARMVAIKSKPSTAIVKVSTIPNAGKGLFADRDYGKHEFICYYSGTVSNVAIEGDRVLQINKQSWIDGSGSCACPEAPGDFLNHKKPFNARFCISSHPQSLVCIRTTKKVKAGEEFFIDYGKDYWESMPVPKTKKQKL